MKYSFTVAGLLALQASAYPFVLDEVTGKAPRTQPKIAKRANGLPDPLPKSGSSAAKALSAGRDNCGPAPCLTFDAQKQFVSTSGDHAFKAPGPSDIRGLCPGLNAAANHGYLNRNGVSSIPNTIQGLDEAYGMSLDLAAFLSAFAVIFNGDPVAGTWSIGGPPPANLISGGLLGQADGITYSHNNYEGDVSIGRKDQYMQKDGDFDALDTDRFQSAFEYTASPDRYTLDKFAENYGMKVQESIDTNPYYFSAPFAGLVAPAAYNFVINFMSNRTAEEPGGYLDGAMFKEFFAITGEPGSFEWHRGQEKIPDNWYKRSPNNKYSAVGVLADLAIQFLAYPDSFVFGGNLGQTNTFTGFDFGDLTGAAFNSSADLLQGDNLQCFFAQAALAGVPDFAGGGVLSAVTGIMSQYVNPILAAANCPAGLELSKEVIGDSKFPGSSFRPKPSSSKMKFMH